MEEDFQLHQQVTTTHRASSGRPLLLTGLIAFLLGIGLAALLVWHGDLDRLVRHGSGAGDTPQQPGAVSAQQTGALETRLALLEDRFSRLSQEATAASGNAARAEALLVASAARRTIDRGEPLGTIAEQLRLRFGDAQPRAIETLAAFSTKPVTLDQLDSRLDALAPEMANQPADVSTWSRVQDELASLFTVRRDPSPAIRPAMRIERAKLLLGTGQVTQAIDEVLHLPGTPTATTWIEDAKRYADAQQALDMIETTAMLDQHLLHDDRGRAIEQPSPLQPAAPSDTP